jgi:hypothetical protein
MDCQSVSPGGHFRMPRRGDVASVRTQDVSASGRPTLLRFMAPHRIRSGCGNDVLQFLHRRILLSSDITIHTGKQYTVDTTSINSGYMEQKAPVPAW